MDFSQIITLILFLVTIGLVILRWIESVAAALMGVVAMVMAGSMTEVQAFLFVDWNVIMILISIWLIAGYFGKTGIPQYVADYTLQLSKGSIPLFVTLIGTLAGFLSPQTSGMAEESGARYNSRQLDPYVARMLAEEPPEVQRSVIGILSLLKSIAKGMSK